MFENFHELIFLKGNWRIQMLLRY